MYITYLKVKYFWLQVQTGNYLQFIQDFTKKYIPLYMNNKNIEIFRSSFLCVLFFGMPFIFFWTDNWEKAKIILSVPYYWIFCFVFGGLYFLNYYYFVPKFYQQRNYSKYWSILLGLFIGFYFLKPFNGMLRQVLLKQGMEYPAISLFRIDPVACILFIILISLGMVLQVIKQWRATEKRALQAETEKANAELAFLKAQINPHFLFNTLNNIYSLSVDQRPETSGAIMKLSNIMRYITDDATHDFVPLKSEINCITDFIDLQRLRLGKNITVDYSVSGKIEGKQIAPLILMTYIENVFKYGISSHENARILIKIQAEKDRINFFCRNKIFAIPRIIERTGVGLHNTEKRLRHLYPYNHNLTITSNNGFYTVDLTLNT